MKYNDHSSHKKIEGPDMTTTQKQGDDTASNPGHGAGENTRKSLKHHEARYIPNTEDADRRTGVHTDEAQDNL